MACGCNKKGNSAQADAARTARVERVAYRPTPVVEGLPATHAMEGTRYRRALYLVAPKIQLAEGDVSEAETLFTLAEAQKRLRDLGSAYGIKAIRAS